MGNEDIVQLLISTGASYRTNEANKYSILNEAILHGYLNIVEIILNTFPESIWVSCEIYFNLCTNLDHTVMHNIYCYLIIRMRRLKAGQHCMLHVSVLMKKLSQPFCNINIRLNIIVNGIVTMAVSIICHSIRICEIRWDKRACIFLVYREMRPSLNCC